MFGHDLSHLRDPNNYSTGSHAINVQTSTPLVQLGIVVANDPVNHTADVQLLSIRANGGLPVILRNLRVSIDSGGDGWGHHNLPWIGQQVEVIFENGISFSSAKAYVGRRFYTTSHRPPSHPIFLSSSNYQKGKFKQAEGGSYTFEKSDGSVTTFGATTQSKEGSKTNQRATGVAKTNTETLMDNSQTKTAVAKQQTELLKTSTANMALTTKQIAQVQTLQTEQRAKTQRTATAVTTIEENNRIDVLIYNATDDQIDDIEDALTPISAGITLASSGGGAAVFRVTKTQSNSVYFEAAKTAIINASIGIKDSTMRRGTSNNAQGNVPEIRIVVE
jgi:hypothetical protein